ncbi:MAG: FG-GAP repeat domain-containing protein [Myxococcota bacterium]
MSPAARHRLLLLVSFGAACAAISSGASRGAAASETAQVKEIIASEEQILLLTPPIQEMAESVLNLTLPDHRSRRFFADETEVRDLVRGAAPASNRPVGPARMARWRLAPKAAPVARVALKLWLPLFAGVDYFEQASFEFVDGTFDAGSDRAFSGSVSFFGLARRKGGTWASVQATIATHWSRSSKRIAGIDGWQIDRWELTGFSTTEIGRRLFIEALDGALTGEEVRKRARGSLHEVYLLDLAKRREKFHKPHRYFRVRPTDSQPGLAVVDVDRDGLDDLYVMDRWGKNLLLHNRGDGSFDEMAAALGLAIENHSSSAIFADFDNDGDDDLFLGRTLEPSVYLVNENGRFRDRSKEMVSIPLPSLVTSVSAADVNGDGLLDVYFSTYAAELLAEETARQAAGLEKFGPLLTDFLDPATSRATTRIYRANHKYLERGGPPNLLLLNRGSGRFGLSRSNEDVALWRNTFQATWADFDRDGDPDLYVANDFSSNDLLRNDGGGRFTDITEETGTADVGFGMGVSWGDYDGDLRQDLYVSNMYSTAGRRITSRVPGLDPRFGAMSRGNTLFRNEPGGFRKVSGLVAPNLLVEKAGWSWGGQFVDVDNDGDLDLYAASGFYTAPGEVAIKGADL